MGELSRLRKDPSVYILWEEDITGTQLGLRWIFRDILM